MAVAVSINSAFSFSNNTTARLTETTLNGSYVAFRTRTSPTMIGLQPTNNYVKLGWAAIISKSTRWGKWKFEPSAKFDISAGSYKNSKMLTGLQRIFATHDPIFAYLMLLINWV
jgi:hypothetical protein